VNRRLFLLLPLSGCSTLEPWNGRTDYHPVASFKWKKTREVEEVTILKVESEDAGKYCSQYTPAMACAVEYGPKWQLFVPPNDPMILAHECLHALGYDHE
jgi:hypothetical protein